MRHTKLVCTLGPATAHRVPELIDAGMDVARINFSHGTDEDRAELFRAVRRARQACGREISILADLQGPKIRLGPLRTERITLRPGRPFVLRPDGGPGDEESAMVSYAGIADDLSPGDPVLLADGAAVLRVVKVGGGEVHTEVERGGSIGSRQGVNVPSEKLSLPAVTDKDRTDVRRALELGADRIAQSFVRHAEDVRDLRRAVAHHSLSIVAKIETQPSIEDFDRICGEADAVMIARGDLGVELPFEELPVIQKDLVRRATTAGVPSVVATQMLESMVRAPVPTRAEASDVANAVLDGADALLLSAETAIGLHPIDAAAVACRLAGAAEAKGERYVPEGLRRGPVGTPEAIARAAASLALADDDVVAIACYTRTGRTATLLSAARPGTPIHAYTPDPEVARRLCLHRGVVPQVCDPPTDTDAMIALMDTLLGAAYERGSPVILVAASPVGRAHTNLLKAHHIGDGTFYSPRAF